MKEMEHNEAFLRFRLGAGAEGDEAAELLLWPAARPNGQAVVACPGGGFNQVALEREGYPFARWFNERGVTYAVLCYRMPHGRAAFRPRISAARWHSCANGRPSGA